jgi:hypothetical protein
MIPPHRPMVPAVSIAQLKITEPPPMKAAPRNYPLIVSLTALILAPLAHAQIVVTRTFTPALLVPDSGEVVDARTFDVGGGAISNLEVDVVLSGASGQSMFNGDYYVTLGHASASAVLLNRSGVTGSNPYGYSDNGIAVTFADYAAYGDIHAYRTTLGGAPAGGVLTGTWAPDGRLVDPANVNGTEARTNTLSAFNGAAPSGEWRLFISDEGAGGAAQLDLWRLRMTVTPDGVSQLNLSDAQLTAGSTASIANPIAISGINRITGSANVTLSGALTGTGTLTKEDAGHLILIQPGAFTGNVAVTGGTLELPAGLAGMGGNLTIAAGSSLIASGSITRDVILQGTTTGPAVGSGQALTFSGTVAGAGNYFGNIVMAGDFSPGNSPAIVSVTGNLSLGASTTMEIGGLTAGIGGYDQLLVSGTLNFGGTLIVSVINNFSPSAGQSFQLFNASAYTSSFSDYQLASLSGALQWNTANLASTGVISVSAIPEPATVAFWFGAVVLALSAYRRRHATHAKTLRP